MLVTESPQVPAYDVADGWLESEERHGGAIKPTIASRGHSGALRPKGRSLTIPPQGPRF